MGKKILKIPSIDSHRFNMQTVRGKNDTMIANQFFVLHEKFFQDNTYWYIYVNCIWSKVGGAGVFKSRFLFSV